jgi:hypothetical protein
VHENDEALEMRFIEVMANRLVNLLLVCFDVENQNAIPISGEDVAKTKHARRYVFAGYAAFRFDCEAEAIVDLPAQCERSDDERDDESTDRNFAMVWHHGW